MFHQITLHDYSRSLSARKEARRYCGPYRWAPAKPNSGRGFYLDMTGRFTCAAHGAGFDLRIEPASHYLSGYERLSRISGYRAGPDSDDLFQPIVLRLPHGRGFLAGWTLGAGMCASTDCTIWETGRDACLAAYDAAERAADEQAEYQARPDQDDLDE